MGRSRESLPKATGQGAEPNNTDEAEEPRLLAVESFLFWLS